MEREVGGGIGMGKTCKLKDVSFQCMTKFTTNKKKKKEYKSLKVKRKYRERASNPVEKERECNAHYILFLFFSC